MTPKPRVLRSRNVRGANIQKPTFARMQSATVVAFAITFAVWAIALSRRDPGHLDHCSAVDGVTRLTPRRVCDDFFRPTVRARRDFGAEVALGEAIDDCAVLLL